MARGALRQLERLEVDIGKTQDWMARGGHRQGMAAFGKALPEMAALQHLKLDLSKSEADDLSYYGSDEDDEGEADWRLPQLKSLSFAHELDHDGLCPRLSVPNAQTVTFQLLT